MRKTLIASLLLALLSGCGFSVSMVETVEKPPEAGIVEKKPGELDMGATKHSVEAQGIVLNLEFSTDQSATSWTENKRANVWLYVSLGTSMDASVVYIKIYDEYGTILEDDGNFTIAPPYVYGTIFATYPRKLYFDIDIVVKVEEGKHIKQRFTDTLKLTPAKKG